MKIIIYADACPVVDVTVKISKEKNIECIVVCLMASKFMKSTNKYITSQIMEEYRELYHNATEAVSYIYASVDSLESAEVVVVFDDKDVNALEQINALVLPTLLKEGLNSLY